jgi:hypothetical protein
MSAPLRAGPIFAALPDAARIDRLIRLRRDGQRPLRFDGDLIARHNGIIPHAPLWHDLGLYHAACGGYAVEIVAWRAGPAAPGTVARCHAFLAPDLDAALARLEGHDAARDICPGLSAPNVRLDDPALSPTALVMQAAALHGLRQDVVRRYRIGVGLFLSELAMRSV